MDVDSYLAHIGTERPSRIDADVLARLQVAHLLSVPFENLDIWRRRPITLDLEAIFEKVVRRRRGGFCYELNGLFAWLLAELGFKTTMLSARVVGGSDGELGPEFAHLILRVDLETAWLVDVGFGDSFRTPMPLQADPEFVDPLGRTFQLERSRDSWDLREHVDASPERLHVASAPLDDEAWRKLLRFSLTPRVLADFEQMCRWQQTESPFFTQHRFCTIATPDGRRTLMDERLIVRSGMRRDERAIDERDVPELLHKLFGVRL
jgi:N-hydroxyarylamine O-acetyltransferase